MATRDAIELNITKSLFAMSPGKLRDERAATIQADTILSRSYREIAR